MKKKKNVGGVRLSTSQNEQRWRLYNKQFDDGD